MADVRKRLLAIRLESLRNRFAECATRFRVDCLMIQYTPEVPITHEEHDALVAKFLNGRPMERTTDWHKQSPRCSEVDSGWLARALTLVGPAQLSDLRALGHDATGVMVEAGICPAPSWFTPEEVWAKAKDDLWWHIVFEWSLSRPKTGDAKPILLVAGNWFKLQLNLLKGEQLTLPRIPSLRVFIDNIAQASCELLREIIEVGFPAIRREIRERNGKPQHLAMSTVDQLCAGNLESETQDDASRDTTVAAPLKLFFSYARTDAKQRHELAKHLASLEHIGLIHCWYDNEILPGAQFEREIANKLAEADIVLLLISSSFVWSEYCYKIELQMAMERHAKDEVCVLPIIIRETNAWKKLPAGNLLLGSLNALPTSGKPISKWKPQNDGWVDVAAGVERAAEALRKRKSCIPTRAGGTACGSKLCVQH